MQRDNPSMVNNTYIKALRQAVIAKNYKSADIMLETISEADRPAACGLAIYDAINKNDLEMIEKLLTNGADQTVCYSNVKEPILHAAVERKWECVERMMAVTKKLDKINHSSKVYEHVLFQAVKHNCESIVDIMLDVGANPNGAVSVVTNNTTLHFAVRNKNISIIIKLLDKGAKVGYLNASRLTAIDYASSNKYWEGVIAIAKSKNEKNVTYLYRGALLRASYYDQYDVVEILLKAGAGTNAQFSENDDTALHCAAANNNLDMIALLMNYGADVTVRNKHDKSPLDVAIAKHNDDCISLMTEKEKFLKEDSDYLIRVSHFIEDYKEGYSVRRTFGLHSSESADLVVLLHHILKEKPATIVEKAHEIRTAINAFLIKKADETSKTVRLIEKHYLGHRPQLLASISNAQAEISTQQGDDKIPVKSAGWFGMGRYVGIFNSYAASPLTSVASAGAASLVSSHVDDQASPEDKDESPSAAAMPPRK